MIHSHDLTSFAVREVEEVLLLQKSGDHGKKCCFIIYFNFFLEVTKQYYS